MDSHHVLYHSLFGLELDTFAQITLEWFTMMERQMIGQTYFLFKTCETNFTCVGVGLLISLDMFKLHMRFDINVELQTNFTFCFASTFFLVSFGFVWSFKFVSTNVAKQRSCACNFKSLPVSFCSIWQDAREFYRRFMFDVSSDVNLTVRLLEGLLFGFFNNRTSPSICWLLFNVVSVH